MVLIIDHCQDDACDLTDNVEHGDCDVRDSDPEREACRQLTRGMLRPRDHKAYVQARERAERHYHC